MIIIFHCLTNFLYHLFKKHIQDSNSWRKFTITKLNSDLHPVAQRDAENDIKFDPPVYKQRYERVTEVLLDEKWKNKMSKIVDFGCSEFGLFVFLKNLAIEIREITFVDIDEPLLRDCLFRVYPLNADHLVQRPRPLTVRIFAGSAADPDPCLLNTDAVIAVELIEHLYPDTLEALPYNIFSFIQPKLAIFTTPNSEFNVLFEKLNKFRHTDHKFEWNREQFESWATNLTLRFPNYMVLFDGIGLGPDGSEDFGSCSQLAVFIRKDIICDNYIRETIACVCNESTCRSLDYLSSVCCYCNCVNCTPKYSYGICTYYTWSKSLLSSYESDKNTEIGYYKSIATIEYPYNDDTRTQEEINLDELKYRIHNLGRVNGNYYCFEKNLSLIPLSKLVYRTSRDFISEMEARTLLLKFNYQIEECVNEETEALESCVIYEPEMDNTGSGSNTEASGYESDNKYTGDEAQFSDWEENDVSWTTSTKKDNESFGQSVKTELHLEVSGNKKQQEALIDSGYQKSPSAPDESPQSLPAVTAEPIPTEFKVVSERPNKLSNILSVFDNFDKINELDAVRKDKKFFNFSSNLPHREVMKKICQEIVRHPIAGPSRDTRRRVPKKSQSSDSDDSTEDVKSITTCILENSLNKIECKEEERHRGDIIQELIQEEAPPAPQEEFVEPVLIVENGDLANNNRDREGNNYPPEDDQEPQIDNAIDNLELNNVNIDNNNEVIDVAPIEEEQPIEEIPDENVEIEPPVDVEVAWSSREALFDVNSQVDLLDDFEMDSNAAVVNGIVIPGNFVVVTNSSDDNSPGPPLEESNFPNWLLQIFEENESVGAEDDMHDEPHFYCQGDGLGVHPSTVAINDDDDDGNESGSDSSSTSGSVDFANAENSTSIQEMFIAPNEPRIEDELVVVGQPVLDESHSVSNPEAEELFENAEESESNLISSSCTQ